MRNILMTRTTNMDLPIVVTKELSRKLKYLNEARITTPVPETNT